MEILLAELILIIHFFIFVFIISCFALIPIGYKFNWIWVKNKSIRLIHICLMGFITLETILGLMCPLTKIEFLLRNESKINNRFSEVIHQIMYWDLSNNYFIIIYITSFLYLIFLWIIFKPT